MKNKIGRIIIIGMMLVLSTIVFTTNVTATENWVVNISPENQTVLNNSYVEITLTANNTGGGAEVTGWIVDVFNWSGDGLMNVTSATEGSWLTNVGSTYWGGDYEFHNSSGNITDLYCMVLGGSGTTDNGTMCTINFTTNKAGVSQLTFTGYFFYGEDPVPYTATTGNITINDDSAPEISDGSPESGTTGDFFLFNVSVTDDVDSASELTVKVNWSHNGTSSNDTMNNVGGNYFEKQISLGHSVSDLTYHIYVNDTYPNSNYTGELTATVTDNDAPYSVSDNSPSGTTADSYNFSLDVNDNIQGESELTCYVNWSHDGSSSNDSMSYSGGEEHWYKVITLDDSVSDLSYTFWVNDTAGNKLEYSGSSPQSVTDNDDPTLVDDGSDISATTGELFHFVLDLSDNIDAESDLSVVKANYTQDAYTANYTMAYSGGSWKVNFTVNDSTSDIVYFFYVEDTAGNKLVTAGDSPVSVTDNDGPVNATDVNVSEKFMGDVTKIFSIDWTNISCNVTDNIAVTGAYLNITHNGTEYTNISILANKTGDKYYSNTTYAAIGTYSVFVHAYDAGSNKVNTGSKSYVIYYKWDLNQDNETDVLDISSVAFHYDETGANRWIKQDLNSDGEISVLDISGVAFHYGEVYE